jgi:hypothetical protein
MFSSAIAAMLLMGAAPAEIRVDVGRIDLAGLPAVEPKDTSLPTTGMVDRVERILADGTCRLPGQSASRFDIDVPYAVFLYPDGSASRVVVSDMGCPAIESLTGLLVLQLARQRDFGATGQAKAKWFGSTLNYNLQ